MILIVLHVRYGTILYGALDAYLWDYSDAYINDLGALGYYCSLYPVYSPRTLRLYWSAVTGVIEYV